MTFSFFRYRLKSLPVIMGICLLFIVSIFTIPSLKQKMFKDDNVSIEQLREGKISKDNINSNARFAMWEHLMTRFYEQKRVVGVGQWLYTKLYVYPFYIRGLKVPHNDYVQILCDNGIIGLILYLLAGIIAIFHSFLIYNRNHRSLVKIVAITAGSTMAGMLLTLYSDNVVNYSMATLSMPFGFYGMMLGLNEAK